MRRSSLAGAFLLLACIGAAAPACSLVEEPTPAGNCPRSPERVAKATELLVIGHRGAAAKEVENTIPSMKRAINDGANAVEIDLSMTKDGVVVLWHDWDPDDTIALGRQADSEANQHARPLTPAKGDAMRRPVDELTLAELREHYGYLVDDQRAQAEIPTLDQFLDWAVAEPALAFVVFDMKIPADRSNLTREMFTKVNDALAARNPSWKHVYLTPHESVYEHAAPWVTDDALTFDVDPGVVVIGGASCDDASSDHAKRRGKGYASTVLPSGIEAEAWDELQKLLSCDLTARDQSSPPVPKKVLVATIDDREQLECLLDMGLDGIITNDPAYFHQVALERGRQPFDPRASITSVPITSTDPR